MNVTTDALRHLPARPFETLCGLEDYPTHTTARAQIGGPRPDLRMVFDRTEATCPECLALSKDHPNFA